jgi:hypothetical protein
MFEYVLMFVGLLRAVLRSRGDLLAENLLLRQQLAVLTRPTRKRPRLRARDKLFWVVWQFDPRLPFVVLAMLAGPAVSGLVMTGFVSGWADLRDLLARLVRWRVGARWCAVALLTAPPVYVVAYFAQSLAVLC